MSLSSTVNKVIYSGNKLMAHGAYWLYCAMWGALIAPMVYLFMARGAILGNEAAIVLPELNEHIDDRADDRFTVGNIHCIVTKSNASTSE